MTDASKPTGLDLMRAPFAAHQISVLPKPYNKDSPKGNCRECGGYHGLPAAHLSYVGHAALTDRLLDCDPRWTWEPVAVDADGMPKLDPNGGMWIRLTVCGVTRLGYGDAQGKTGPNAVKERIGDALRNAAMRFGAALDLWHKGELHLDEETGDERDDAGNGKRASTSAQAGQQPEGQQQPSPPQPETYPQADFKKNVADWSKRIQNGKKVDDLIAFIESKGKPLTEDQKKTLRAVKPKPAEQQGAAS